MLPYIAYMDPMGREPPQCALDRDLYVDQTRGAIHQFLTRRKVIQHQLQKVHLGFATKVPWDAIGKSWNFYDEPMDW
jgi:hypothetical protein